MHTHSSCPFGLMGFPVDQLDPLCWDSRDCLTATSDADTLRLRPAGAGRWSSPRCLLASEKGEWAAGTHHMAWMAALVLCLWGWWVALVLCLWR